MPKIAVIDDEFEFLELMKRYFASDYDITGFTDYPSAAKEVRKGEFDAIVLDILMPDQSGLEALKDIKNISSSTPVIMVTASKNRQNIIEALRLGADDYLEKPFDFKIIRNRIDESLKRKNLPIPPDPPERLVIAPNVDLSTANLDGRVKSVMAIIAVDYHSSINLNTLGRIVNLAPYYLGRLIKKETGLSFKEILARYRLKKSSDLLLNSQRRINEVAKLCGFNNFHYFCRLFHRFYGIPPSGYRKRSP